jgi:hypothetical protein
MSRLNHGLARTVVAGLAVGGASVLAASAALPAGAMTPAAAAPAPTPAEHPAQPAHPQLTATTPMCLVGAALLYPVFLGGVILGNPASLPSAAPGYWVGGESGPHDGDHFHGWLPKCGVSQ